MTYRAVRRQILMRLQRRTRVQESSRQRCQKGDQNQLLLSASWSSYYQLRPVPQFNCGSRCFGMERRPFYEPAGGCYGFSARSWLPRRLFPLQSRRHIHLLKAGWHEKTVRTWSSVHGTPLTYCRGSSFKAKASWADMTPTLPQLSIRNSFAMAERFSDKPVCYLISDKNVLWKNIGVRLCFSVVWCVCFVFSPFLVSALL